MPFTSVDVEDDTWLLVSEGLLCRVGCAGPARRRKLGYCNLVDARRRVHIFATDGLSGNTVVMSEGPASQAIIASAAGPAAFEPLYINDLYLADGAVSSSTP